MKRIRNGKLSWLTVLSELKMRGSGGSGGEAEEEAQLSWQGSQLQFPSPAASPFISKSSLWAPESGFRTHHVTCH